MNLYLLTFKQGNKKVQAWHKANNAGEAVNLLEDKGVEVIKTFRIYPTLHEYIEMSYPTLDFWLKLLETDIRYKELQPKPQLKPLAQIPL